MKKKIFVIGDIHGMSSMLDTILLDWNPEEEQLVFLGDIIDRGPQIKESFEKVRELQASHDAWVICGNHEAMLLDFLNDPHKNWRQYERNGGMTTLCALTGKSEKELTKLTLKDLAKATINAVPDLVEWINNLPLYIEYGNWVFVHAGVNLYLSDWRQSGESRFYWIREEFHQANNHTGKKFVFGHTPLQHLNADLRNLKVWEHQGKYGIDGGAVYGGDLIGLHLDKEGAILKESRVKGKY